MSLRFAVLRPEPGNAATAARLARHDVLRLPLFVVGPLDWTRPPLGDVDALLVTSANAVRHGGDAMASLRHLPVIAVGAATARAAEAAGFAIAAVGTGDARAALTLAAGRRLLHLTGRDHVALPGVPALAVYAADPVEPPPAALADLAGRTALLHSPRAARRLAELVGDARQAIAIAALGPAVAQAAGAGWRDVVVAAQPSDIALVTCAIDRARGGGDNDRHD
ncbi:uroporphyrinogen-III synthase [Sphingomonas jinjuensis]|uniref:Uroporphyrinogen-III synthase n=1 Tax=Sphingomonas jinjuensis TaxID=535907 RepID=A0A840EZR8_9SPHN|nr:uroporphyrinogen-III synthase [Sphingomonas jinjuensis]